MGASQASAPNPGLSWEKTDIFNLGLDLGFFDNRLGLSFEGYDKYTHDMLYSGRVSSIIDNSTVTRNVGSMENIGFEATLSANIIRRENFDWTVQMNGFFNRNKTFKHTIEIVVDRIVVKAGQEGRIAEACELAIAQGDGLVEIEGDFYDHHYEKTFSTKLACPDHGVSIEELEPRMFSFNAPFGACPTCNGLGFTQKLDPSKLINEDLSIREGALQPIFGTMEFSG